MEEERDTPEEQQPGEDVSGQAAVDSAGVDTTTVRAQPEEPDRPLEPATPDETPDFLYEETETQLRQGLQDAFRDLYGEEIDPSSVLRLNSEEVRAWLADLDGINPEMADYARLVLGDVLDERFTVGFLVEDANPAGCARFHDVLYVPIPGRYRVPAERPFEGLIIRDECMAEGSEICLQCGGRMSRGQEGAVCSCVCAPGRCPGLECTDC